MPEQTTSQATRSTVVQWWRSYRIARRRALARSATTVRFRLTREGFHLLMVVVFIFVGAVLRDINLLILIAAAMIGLLLLQWRFNVGTIRGLSATRKMPERVTEGVVADCRVTVRNSKSWLGAWLVLIEDGIFKVAPGAHRTVGRGVTLVDEVPASGSARASYELLFRSRGRYRIGPCTLSTRFPLSLGRGWRKLDLQQEIIVHPRPGELTSAGRNLVQSDREGQAKSSTHAGVHETEFFGLRPWATGDSRRWIHWRTSARLGELSVRQFERLQHQQACILLDLYQAKGDQGPSWEQACERAISFVASLAIQTVRGAGNRIAVAVAADRVVTLTNIQSPTLVTNLLDELSVIAPTAQPDHGNALTKMSVTLLQNPNLLVISTRADCRADLRLVLSRILGGKAASRMNIRWINVQQGELEPYFTWTPAASNDSERT